MKPHLRKQTARIAIIIPCFNDGATLREAVRSAQDQEDSEIVVVNDGSTDAGTLCEFREIEREGVNVVHQANLGLAAARRAGVQSSSARYVFALDADDFLIGDSLTELADYLDEHPEVGLVWGRYRFAGELTHERDVASSIDPWQVTYFNDMPVAMLIRRDVLVRAGGWQAPPGYEDWDLSMRLAEDGVLGTGLRTVVYRHRVHGARMRVGCIPRHSELYATLRSRHKALFDARSTNRRRSPASRGGKVVVELVSRFALLSEYRRMTIAGQLFRLADSGRRPYVIGGLVRAVRRRLRLPGAKPAAPQA